MNIQKDDRVILRRDIQRVNYEVSPDPQPYALKGDSGVVEETFYQSRTWYAKVRINNELKTFRLTSLEKV